MMCAVGTQLFKRYSQRALLNKITCFSSLLSARSVKAHKYTAPHTHACVCAKWTSRGSLLSVWEREGALITACVRGVKSKTINSDVCGTARLAFNRPQLIQINNVWGAEILMHNAHQMY